MESSYFRDTMPQKESKAVIGVRSRNLRTVIALAVFAATFFALEYAWEQCRGSDIETWVIDRATVLPAAWTVNRLWPDRHALAHANSLISARGRLNILNGCEGLETLFLLVAAFVAYPLAWRGRAIGILFSALLIYVLNQMRIVVLWWSVQFSPSLFGLLHGTVLPLVLIAIALLFFLAFVPPVESDIRARRPAGR